MSVSIATKPPTKRATKLILRGDHGKHARHDNSKRISWEKDVKPPLDIGTAISESLDGVMFVLDVGSTNGRRSNGSVFTTESPGFAVKPPTHRRRVRSVRRAQAVTSKLAEPPRFDSAGRPIVVVSDCDAWSLRCR